MADLVFAFDAALDRPIPGPESAPAGVRAALADAPRAAFAAAVATARETHAAALVLFGDTLDPLRASPAQAAFVRDAIAGLAADGCRTVWMVAEPTACTAVARALGEPPGLTLVSPLSPTRQDIHGIAVDLICLPAESRGIAASARVAPSFASEHASLLPAQHRIVVGWEESWAGSPVAHAVSAPLATAGAAGSATSFVWGSRRPQPIAAGVLQLPALQARGPREAGAGSCGVLGLTGLAALADGTLAATAAGRGAAAVGWREVPTHSVAWRGLSVASTVGGDEELAAVIQAAFDSLVVDPRGPLQVVRVNVECGTSVSRRVRVAELVAETMARLRLPDDAAARIWCHELGPDPLEPMTVLARGPSGHGHVGGGGATDAFAAALATLVAAREAVSPSTLDREAGWMALELMGST